MGKSADSPSACKKPEVSILSKPYFGMCIWRGLLPPTTMLPMRTSHKGCSVRVTRKPDVVSDRHLAGGCL